MSKTPKKTKHTQKQSHLTQDTIASYTDKSGMTIVPLDPNESVGFVDESNMLKYADAFDALFENETAADAVIAALEKRRDGFNAKSKKAKKIDAAIKQVKKAFERADGTAAIDKSPNYWLDAFTPKRGLPAAARPARDYYTWVDPFAAEKETAQTPQTPAAKAPATLFTPSAKTKRTVVFLVDGSGSFGNNHRDPAKTSLNKTLAAIQRVTKRRLGSHDTHPAYEVILFGDKTPCVIDKTATRHADVGPAYFAPSINALKDVAAAHPGHMLHVVILGEGGVHDPDDSLRGLRALMAASPRVTVDALMVAFVGLRNCHLGDAVQTLDPARAAMAETFPSEALIADRLASLLLPRLAKPLPPTAKPAKRQPRA